MEGETAAALRDRDAAQAEARLAESGLALRLAERDEAQRVAARARVQAGEARERARGVVGQRDAAVALLADAERDAAAAEEADAAGDLYAARAAAGIAVKESSDALANAVDLRNRARLAALNAEFTGIAPAGFARDAIRERNACRSARR